MLRIPNRQNLLPLRYRTPLSIPKVPICKAPFPYIAIPPSTHRTCPVM